MGRTHLPHWGAEYVVMGDFNTDMESPRDAREAELSEGIMDRAALRGLARHGAGAPTRR